LEPLPRVETAQPDGSRGPDPAGVGNLDRGLLIPSAITLLSTSGERQAMSFIYSYQHQIEKGGDCHDGAKRCIRKKAKGKNGRVER